MKKVLYSDLEIQDSHNTYVSKGLLLDPIASPCGPSIEAALYTEEYLINKG